MIDEQKLHALGVGSNALLGEPKPALLPCPFCGEAAAWCTDHHVACANEACALGLSEFLCWPDQWNKRAQTTAEKLLRRAVKYVSTAPDLTQPGGDELRTEILDHFLPPNASLSGEPGFSGESRSKR